MLCAQRYGQLSRRVSNCACRDSFSICASSHPKLPQITQNHTDLGKTETADLQKKAARALRPAAARETLALICHARPMYAPVRVSILIASPSLIKSGTL